MSCLFYFSPTASRHVVISKTGFGGITEDDALFCLVKINKQKTDSQFVIVNYWTVSSDYGNVVKISHLKN